MSYQSTGNRRSKNSLPSPPLTRPLVFIKRKITMNLFVAFFFFHFFFSRSLLSARVYNNPRLCCPQIQTKLSKKTSLRYIALEYNTFTRAYVCHQELIYYCLRVVSAIFRLTQKLASHEVSLCIYINTICVHTHTHTLFFFRERCIHLYKQGCTQVFTSSLYTKKK